MSRRHLILILPVVLSVITYLERVCIAIAGPRMQEDLGLTPERWGWVLGGFAIAYGIFEIPTGALGDRYGRRRVLTRIVVWWSAFTALTWDGLRLRGAAGDAPALRRGGGGGVSEHGGGSSAAGSPPRDARAQGLIWSASRLGGRSPPGSSSRSWRRPVAGRVRDLRRLGPGLGAGLVRLVPRLGRPAWATSLSRL